MLQLPLACMSVYECSEALVPKNPSLSGRASKYRHQTIDLRAASFHVRNCGVGGGAVTLRLILAGMKMKLMIV